MVLVVVVVVNIKYMHRYLNHSRGEENLKAHRPLFVNGMPRVAFLASRDIAAGEELLWDYGADTRYSPKWMKGTKKGRKNRVS